MKPNLTTIENLPLAFSQVREDPLLDLELLRSIHGKNLRVLMVASGGDSLCCLAAQKNVCSIDAVDFNSAQLRLSEIKLSLLKESPDFRLKLLGHKQCDPYERGKALEGILSNFKDEVNLGPRRLINIFGLDFSGRYEQLFRLIQRDLFEGILKDRSISEVLEADDFELFKSELKKVFDQYFDLPLLVRLFGEEATQNPHQSFKSHFLERTLQFLENPDNSRSPFLNQLLKG